MDLIQSRFPVENGDNVRLQRTTSAPVRKQQCTSRHYAAGISQNKIVTTSKYSRKDVNRAHLNHFSPFPPLKSEAAPAQRAGTTSLLMLDDVTKHLSGCQ
jgi:hypothetical protein